MTQFSPDPGWLKYCERPARPLFRLPSGAVDAHCHVFGPGNRFAFAPGRRYTPCDAPKEALFRIRDRLGFTRNVIVQATCHGSDNSALLDAIFHARGRARGVASVAMDVSRGELKTLNDAGIKGIRFNFVRRLADPRPEDEYLALAERVAEFGWHVLVYFEAADLPERRNLLSSFPVPVVIDHLGRPDVSKPPDGPEFEMLMDLMRENGNIWAKVTGAERLSAEGPPGYADALPFSRRVVREFPSRVLWGTDWPHPNLKSHMPDDGSLVDTIPNIATTREEQRALLVDNPMRLYWPESVSRR